MSLITRSGHLLGAGGGIVSVSSGGGSLSSLATQVNGMSSGTWATWTGGFLPNTINNPLADDPVISNSSVLNWDPVNKLIMFYGKGHGNDYQSLMLDYQDANNGWINTSGVPLPAGVATGTHQFTGQTANQANGDLYFFYQGGNSLVRPGGGSTWTDLGSLPQGSHGQGCGAAFLPQYGTQGGAIFASFYGIDVWDVGASAWTSLSMTGLSIGDGSQFRQCLGFFDVAATAAFFVSVQGANDKAVVKVASNGATSQKGAAPVSVNCNIASPGAGMIVDGYTSTSTLPNQNTSGTVRKPMLVVPGGVIYEYTSASDTWAQVFSGTSPTSSVANFALFIGCCKTYDCVIIACQTASDGSATLSVYKR